MKQIIFYIVFILFSNVGTSQETLSEVLETYNSQRVPYISVDQLNMQKTEVILLDARELVEYNVSHIKNARHVGYHHFKIDEVTKTIDKTQPIVIYCSLGVRSEDIAEKLVAVGYTNVKNLYGGIFEWKNNGFEVYSFENTPTENVHAYSKKWSKWLQKGKKVYTKRLKTEY